MLLLAAAMGCVSEPSLTYPTSPPAAPPPAPVPPPSSIADARISEIVIPNLPSPQYRFTYDSSGRVTFASYASDLRTYDIQYEGNRMAGMTSTRSPTERLAYSYDATGRATLVTYADHAGNVYVRVHLAYVGARLVRLERARLIDGAFQVEKRLSFAYDAAGNLAELTDQRLPVGGLTEATVVDRFEGYDKGINVDGFSLIHTESADHLLLLPGVRLQLGNPAEVTRSGSSLNYHIDYSYTYDAEGRPLTKHGEVVVLGGVSAGQRFQTNAAFSYE
jgi:hypothetical protein